ncbi:phosphopantetheinyl transferase [Nonomuraea sp. ATR24]|uniref:phosphopantetheinyl transferase n=1 Tax=Nonomuraea sp. ATR24 TaxID=1676744 RepID=UPI0035BFB2B3
MRRWGSAIVGHAGLGGPRDLVAGMPLEVVFTRAERVRSGGRTLQRWAGRLAAKRAVLRLLGLPADAERLGQVEILPLPTPACAADAACRDGHPPSVRLLGDLPALAASVPGWIRVSVSHTDLRALALAVRTPRLPEDGSRTERTTRLRDESRTEPTTRLPEDEARAMRTNRLIEGGGR